MRPSRQQHSASPHPSPQKATASSAAFAAVSSPHAPAGRQPGVDDKENLDCSLLPRLLPTPETIDKHPAGHPAVALRAAKRSRVQGKLALPAAARSMSADEVCALPSTPSLPPPPRTAPPFPLVLPRYFQHSRVAVRVKPLFLRDSWFRLTRQFTLFGQLWPTDEFCPSLPRRDEGSLQQAHRHVQVFSVPVHVQRPSG